MEIRVGDRVELEANCGTKAGVVESMQSPSIVEYMLDGALKRQDVLLCQHSTLFTWILWCHVSFIRTSELKDFTSELKDFTLQESL